MHGMRVVSTESSLEPFPHSLDLECPVPWASPQETVIGQDYPFSPIKQQESLEDFVIRRYLETLWLPESIMPLHHFVRSLRRVMSTPSGPHPLDAALRPLLLSVRGTKEKYNSELPQILHDGGGAGELEETVMWFAWSKEKFEQDGREEDGKRAKGAEEEWKKSWMERLERREVQIQILLYLQVLALPAPPPTTPMASSKKRKRKQPRGPPTPAKPLFPPTSSMEPTVLSAPPTPAKSIATSTTANVGDDLTLDDRLEYFMDRLSLWQLLASLNPRGSSQPAVSQPTVQKEKDWAQAFCDDVVDPLFKDLLPEQCALLRSKVFPHSPFSDHSDNEPSPPPPDLRAVNTAKTQRKRPASPLRLTELQKPKTESSQLSSRRTEPQEPRTAPERHRSRSRSVSISVEEVRARGASRGGVASSKNLFKDEVEMKRSAPRVPRLNKPAPSTESQQSRRLIRQNSVTNSFPAAELCASQPHSPRQTQEHKTLATDTPVKKPMKVENQEPDIVMDSPDALLLTGKHPGGNYENIDRETQQLVAGQTFVMDTPVKKRSRG